MRPASILSPEDAGITFLRNIWDIVNYRLDGPEFESRHFSFPETSRRALRPTPATCSLDTRVFPRLTWPGRKVDHPLHLGPGSRMSGAILPRPPICLHGVGRDNFTFFTFLRKIGEFLLDCTKPQSSQTDLSLSLPLSLSLSLFLFSKS